MSAFLGRISDGVELLGRRAVDARRPAASCANCASSSASWPWMQLDVLLGALDVVVLLGDAAGAARGAS